MKEVGTMKCVKDGSNCIKVKSKFQGFDIDAFRCKKCGEEYFDPDKAEEILVFNKLQRKRFKIKAGQIQSNIILRIPVEVSKSLGIKKGNQIELKVEDKNKISVEV